MSLLGDLGNVFHAIGHFVSGSDGNSNAGTTFDDQQDKQRQQQQSQAPQQTFQPQQSGTNNDPTSGNMINLTPLEKAPGNPSSLTNNNNNPPAAPTQLAKAPTPPQAPNQNSDSGYAGAQDPGGNGGGGFWHNITHNGVTNWVGNDIVKPTESAFKGAGQGLARIMPGGMNDINAEANQVSQDNQNVQDAISKYKSGQLTKQEEMNLINSSANDSSQAASTLDKTVSNMPTTEQFAGDLAQVGAFMIPGAGEGASEGASLAARAGLGALKGAGTGAVFGAGSGMSNNEDLTHVLESSGEGAAMGAAAGAALPVIGAGLRKVGSFVNPSASADAAQVAPGLKGANPDLPPTPNEADFNTPSYQTAPARAAAAAQAQADRSALEKATVPDTPLDTVPSFQHNQNIQAVIEDGNQRLNNWANDNPNATQAEIDAAKQSITQDVTDKVNQLNANRMPSFGDVIKDEVTNPATIAEGSTVAGTVAKEVADEAAHAADQHTPPPAQEPLPVVQFDEGPAVTPGTLPPDTVGANPTAAVVKTPSGTPAPTSPAITPLPLNERGSVPGAVAAEPPRGVVQTPEQIAATQQPVQVAQPTAPVTVDTAAQTAAPTVADQTQAAAAQQASEAPAPLLGSGDVKSERHIQAMIDNASNPVMKDAYAASALAKDNPGYQELLDNSQRAVQGQTLDQLVENYGGDKPIGNAQQYYDKLAAIGELEKYPNVPAAQQAAADALSSMSEFESNNGYNLGATKIAYDNMPATMKVNYLNKIVEKAGSSLSPAELDALYSAADLQTKFAQAAQDAENAVHEYSTQVKTDPNFNDNMKALLAREQEAQGVLYDQNRNVLDIIQRNLPKSDLGTRVAQQARTAMLSSIGGRGFAMTSTLGNGAQWLADNTLSSLYGKVINKVNGNNAVRASFARPTTLVKGAVTGFKNLGRDTFGSSPVQSVDDALKGKYDNEYSHDSTRYGFIGNHVTAPLRKIVKFGVGSHLAATHGIEDATLEASARQAAEEAGIPKENMQGFVNYYKAHPPQAQADEARQAWMAANNLHHNAVSDTLSKAANAIETLGGKAGDNKAAAVTSFVAKQIRTVFVPFSHYMGGFVDKALTDRNMFYNIARAATARSPQELSDQLAHLTTNVGTAVGAGYGLAQAGIITNKDQNGKNYDGLYFHVGNHYIPVAIAGQAAMPIIMGATYQQSMHDGSGGQSWPKHVVTAAMQSGDDILKATGVSGTFGGNSPVNELLAGNGEAAVPKIAGAAVQQHIPAVTGDINAGLNYSPLNPTREAADTKVTYDNAATGRQDTNQVATQVNKTLNEIPIASQLLPRQQGVQATSELDRILHAGSSSQSQLDAAKLAKAQLSQDQQDYKNDVPIYKPGKGNVPKGYSFDNTFNSDVQTGKYDQAIAGLNNELKSMTTPGPEHIPPSQIQDVKDKATQLGVAKDNKLSYKDMQLYNNTSVSTWRDMGNPDSDKYDPATYQKLWAIDKALADKNVAGHFTVDAKNSDTSKLSGTQKYSLSSGKSKGSSAASLVKDNKIGSLSAIPNEDFTTNLTAKPITAKIPQIALTKPDTLIKAHQITVHSPRA